MPRDTNKKRKINTDIHISVLDKFERKSVLDKGTTKKNVKKIHELNEILSVHEIILYINLQN